jgi:hypothetical protein
MEDFARLLKRWGPEKKWTILLLQFVGLGVAEPGNCSCLEPRDLVSERHRNHAEFNQKVRAVIFEMPGAREGLYKALYRDVRGPLLPDDPEYGRIVHRVYGEALLDFLRAEPQMQWFREPYKPDQLYQGSALNDQERNPGLTN